MTDFVDEDHPNDSLDVLAQSEKVFFDVDDSWKQKLGDVRKIRKVGTSPISQIFLEKA